LPFSTQVSGHGIISDTQILITDRQSIPTTKSKGLQIQVTVENDGAFRCHGPRPTVPRNALRCPDGGQTGFLIERNVCNEENSRLQRMSIIFESQLALSPPDFSAILADLDFSGGAVRSTLPFA
jgi:hypothetical protein